jgi:hypothetical protein
VLTPNLRHQELMLQEVYASFFPSVLLSVRPSCPPFTPFLVSPYVSFLPSLFLSSFFPSYLRIYYLRDLIYKENSCPPLLHTCKSRFTCQFATSHCALYFWHPIQVRKESYTISALCDQDFLNTFWDHQVAESRKEKKTERKERWEKG